jgi:plastocyanin
MSKSKAFIAAVVVVTVLVGCGGNDVANDSTTIASETTKVTITLAPTSTSTTSTSTTAPPVTATTGRAPVKTTTTITTVLTATTIPASSTTTTVAATPFTPTTVAAPKVHQVTTSGFSFSPSSLTIAVGDTVEFQIGGSHDVAWGCSGTTYAGSYSRTFSSAGSFSYCCTRHPGMNGVITVQ